MPQKIEMSVGDKPRSVSIFAPNATGKSSLADSIDFYFSEDGTLTRLGRQRSDVNSGPSALKSHQAEAKNIDTQVELNFRDDQASFGDVRSVSAPPSARTAAAQKVKDLTSVDFIIRGKELDQFVLESGEKRYESVSSWFGLEALLIVQRKLRTIRLDLEDKLEDESFDEVINNEVSTITDSQVVDWSSESAVAWLQATLIDPLDSSLIIDNLSMDSEDAKTLLGRKEEEAARLGIEAIDGLVQAGTVIKNPAGLRDVGSIDFYVDQLDNLQIAQAVDESERVSASEAVFNAVWDQADQLLTNLQTPTLNCPVCDTPLANTPHGDQSGLHSHVKDQLTRISSARAASAVLESLNARLTTARQKLLESISNVLALCSATSFPGDLTPLEVLKTELESWSIGDPNPDMQSASDLVKEFVVSLKEQRESILSDQGKHTYDDSFSVFSKLVEIQQRVDSERRYLSELKSQLKKITEIAEQSDNIIRGHIQSIADSLSDEVGTIFNDLQGSANSIPAIKFELPPSTATNQRRLMLRAALSVDRTSEPPSGYLSDSETHSLALALRLTAIRRFNPDFRSVVLDDVVTSYDAEHRLAIASVIATKFEDIQFLVLTHDEMFFKYLKERAKTSKWLHRRIRQLDPAFGPRLETHLIGDEVIDDLHLSNDTAANEMRISEEEWLERICVEFGVDIRIRTTVTAHEYQRSELAESLGRFLKSRGLNLTSSPGSANPFLASLQQGQLENLGSHFSNDPYVWSSIGDEKQRWGEFKEFKAIFKCPNCGRRRFKRPHENNLPQCAKDTCETPFGFS